MAGSKNLSCPNCDNSRSFSTIEKIVATSPVEYITIDGRIEWFGDTSWDDSETIGIVCVACGWEKLGPVKDWMANLIEN
jgi:hypothetical protein